MDNILLLTDSYKLSHYKQYPEGSEVVYSYFESRGGKFDKTVFFGLQYYLKRYLAGQVVTQAKIDEAYELAKAHFGNENLFNKEGWEYILKEHEGKLPIKIKAVPEGTPVNVSNALMTIENTDPKGCYWLTNYLETLLVQTWYPTTTATISYYMKQMILKYLEETGDPTTIGFKLHDFGFRGVSSVESASTGGAGHLLNFLGSDTMSALVLAKRYYGSEIAGFSIPASEHSTITSWGRENEVDAMENMLDQYPEGLVACVSDSFDIYNACENLWGDKLRSKILKRKGTLVVRPDSGDPVEVVLKVMDILGEKFGFTYNDKGYKVLHPNIRVIQGDGCDLEKCTEILEAMKQVKWSADNIGFGMGGGLLQKLDRDTQKFAFKCSAIRRDGKWHPVFKDPVTDSGKLSKGGRLKLLKVDGGKSYSTVKQDVATDQKDALVEVFNNGNIVKEYTFDECRENTEK